MGTTPGNHLQKIYHSKGSQKTMQSAEYNNGIQYYAAGGLDFMMMNMNKDRKRRVGISAGRSAST